MEQKTDQVRVPLQTCESPGLEVVVVVPRGSVEPTPAERAAIAAQDHQRQVELRVQACLDFHQLGRELHDPVLGPLIAGLATRVAECEVERRHTEADLGAMRSAGLGGSDKVVTLHAEVMRLEVEAKALTEALVLVEQTVGTLARSRAADQQVRAQLADELAAQRAEAQQHGEWHVAAAKRADRITWWMYEKFREVATAAPAGPGRSHVARWHREVALVVASGDVPGDWAAEEDLKTGQALWPDATGADVSGEVRVA